jgi:hypothetical protein
MQDYPSQRSAELTVELAKTLIATLQERVSGWERAYIRFEASDGHYGAKGSYVTSSGVFLFDVFEFKDLFSQLMPLGVDLRNELSRDGSRFCLFLLNVDSNFGFNIDYEWKDATRWKISKMSGASGLPDGVAGA